MFIVTMTYEVPLERIDEALPLHRAWLEKHYAAGTFVASGRLVPRTGGVILAHGVDRAELDRILATDPFDGMRGYVVTEFVPTMVAPGLESIAEQLS